MLIAQRVQDGCCSKQWKLTREKAQSLPQGANGLTGKELVQQVCFPLRTTLSVDCKIIGFMTCCPKHKCLQGQGCGPQKWSKSGQVRTQQPPRNNKSCQNPADVCHEGESTFVLLELYILNKKTENWVFSSNSSTFNIAHSMIRGFPSGSAVKDMPAMQETWRRYRFFLSLGWEDTLD